MENHDTAKNQLDSDSDYEPQKKIVKQPVSETSDSDSEDEPPKVFHEENLVIISSNEKINMMRGRSHLKENWERLMKENTRLLVLAGVHGKEDGRLGENGVEGKDNFVKDSEGQVEFLKDKFGNDIQKKNISFAVKDVGSHRNRSELDSDAFVSTVREFQPTMLLLAFCWSHKSELNDLLRAAGIFSTLILRYNFILSYLLKSHSQGGTCPDH